MNEENFLSVLKANNLTANSKLVVGFSGGPDSVALVVLLAKNGFQPILAYINYHDSPTVDREESVVRATAMRYGFKVFKADAERPSGVNFEAWAREYRYRFFQKVYRAHQAEALLLAHQANDVAETYILQKQRRAQVDHYGIKESNQILEMKVVRPLLAYSKAQLEDYLITQDILFYADPTNADLSRQRNFWRQQLREDQLPAIRAEIEKANRQLEEDNFLLEPLLEQSKIELSAYRQLTSELQNRLLYTLIKKNLPSIDPKRWAGLVNIAKNRLRSMTSFREFLADDRYLYSDKRCFFIACKTPSGSYHYQIDHPGFYRFKEFSIDLSRPEIFNIFFFPITISNAKVGDRLNTKLRQKNVRHFIKKMGVPSYLIDLYPVIKNREEEVIYVPYYQDLVEHLIPFSLLIRP